MSNDEFFRTMTRWKEMLILGVMLSGIVSIVCSIIFSGVMTIWGPSIRKQSQDWLGITAIGQAIEELAGTNRVTEQPEGLSYVRQPVYMGEQVELVIYIGRTDMGMACILKEIVPLFVDDVGRTYAGNPRSPTQQLGNDIVRRELSIDLPDDIPPGYVALTLQLEYTCGQAVVFETTETVDFQLLPAV